MIRSESELARIVGTDGRSAAVQVRGFVAAGAFSLAVFGIPCGRRFPEGDPLAAPEDATEETPPGGAVSEAAAV